jgi:hypothetical protein
MFFSKEEPSFICILQMMIPGGFFGFNVDDIICMFSLQQDSV